MRSARTYLTLAEVDRERAVNMIEVEDMKLAVLNRASIKLDST